MAEVTISYELIQRAAQHADVRARTKELAEKVARRAERIAAEEGVEMTVTVQSGTRPGGRPFSNVVSDNVEQEWGGHRVKRRRILGRAGEGA